MGIREHLSYSNVAATLALAVALGTGGAYAAEQFGSNDIRNNSIRSADLKNRKAVRGKDVRRDTLGARVIDEGSLRVSKLVRSAGDVAGSCTPDVAVYMTCVDTTVHLNGPGRVFVIATGDFDGSNADSTLNCSIALNGNNEGSGGTPSGLGEFGFAYTLVKALPRGTHTLALRCERVGGLPAELTRSSIAVLGINR